VSAADFLNGAKRDAVIVRALINARLALDCSHGLTAQCDGEDMEINNERESDGIDEALRLLGVDPTEPLPVSMPHDD
jgi:hypothetical protein